VAEKNCTKALAPTAVFWSLAACVQAGLQFLEEALPII